MDRHKSYEDLVNQVELLTAKNKEIEAKLNEASELLDTLSKVNCSPSDLLRMVKSDFLYWAVRRAYKNGIDDVEDYCYIEFYDLTKNIEGVKKCQNSK